jgi:hypothetical protein
MAMDNQVDESDNSDMPITAKSPDRILRRRIIYTIVFFVLVGIALLADSDLFPSHRNILYPIGTLMYAGPLLAALAIAAIHDLKGYSKSNLFGKLRIVATLVAASAIFVAGTLWMSLLVYLAIVSWA